MSEVFFSLAALVTLFPAVMLGLRDGNRRDGFFYAALAAGVAGPLTWVIVHVSGGWSVSLGSALWITICTTMIFLAITALVTDHGWRLLPLTASYLVCLGVIATIWHGSNPMGGEKLPDGWVRIHVVLSVTTYALATLAALAALSAAIQERALKRKQSSRLTRQLPSVADSERMLVKLLTVAEIALGLGIVTGMASEWDLAHRLLAFDHKAVLTIAAFLVIGALLIAQSRTGLRGKRASRLVLVGYLLLTLGYPGVKFVTQVLLHH